MVIRPNLYLAPATWRIYPILQMALGKPYSRILCVVLATWHVLLNVLSVSEQDLESNERECILVPLSVVIGEIK